MIRISLLLQLCAQRALPRQWCSCYCCHPFVTIFSFKIDATLVAKNGQRLRCINRGITTLNECLWFPYIEDHWNNNCLCHWQVLLSAVPQFQAFKYTFSLLASKPEWKTSSSPLSFTLQRLISNLLVNKGRLKTKAAHLLIFEAHRQQK